MSGDFLDSHRLLTLRAADPDPSASARRCEALGAEGPGSDAFWETCFRTAHGLVLLRERAGAPARLIYSTPPDRSGADEVVHLVGVRQPEPVIDALLRVAELVGVVAVERRLFAWEGTRIAIDDVEGLGEFLTIRVPIVPAARTQLATLREALQIHPRATVGRTYAELLGDRSLRARQDSNL
jgi:hypothetical protein